MSAVDNNQKQVHLPDEGAVDDRNTLEGQMVSSINTSRLAHIIASQTRKHLFGMEYPASKVGLFRYAQRSGAPEIVLQALDKLPPKSYRSLAHVVSEMKIFSHV